MYSIRSPFVMFPKKNESLGSIWMTEEEERARRIFDKACRDMKPIAGTEGATVTRASDPWAQRDFVLNRLTEVFREAESRRLMLSRQPLAPLAYHVARRGAKEDERLAQVEKRQRIAEAHDQRKYVMVRADKVKVGIGFVGGKGEEEVVG